MQFPGFDNIYSLGEPFATRPFRGSLREATPNLDFYAVASGRTVPHEAVRVVPYGGRDLTDFIWTDAAVLRLVSHRVLALLRESRISGWSTFPVEVSDRNGEPIGGFEGFSVIGRCGQLNPAMSIPTQKEFPGGIFPYFRGYYFKPESWDGSHVFSPEGRVDIFVTGVVRDLLRQSKTKNVEYRAITGIEFGEYEKTLMERSWRRLEPSSEGRPDRPLATSGGKIEVE